MKFPREYLDYKGRPYPGPQPMGHVYFVQGEETRKIKIGTSAGLFSRFSHLRQHATERLSLLGLMKGDHDLEHELHVRFAHLRMHGEWFACGGDLLQFIREEAQEELERYGREVDPDILAHLTRPKPGRKAPVGARALAVEVRDLRTHADDWEILTA